jgi:hypothetical protein
VALMQLYVDMDGVLANFDWYHHTVVGDLSDKLLDNADWDAVEIYKISTRPFRRWPTSPQLWARIRRHFVARIGRRTQ